MSPTKDQAKAFRGAVKMLQHNLSLVCGETVAVFFDETGQAPARLLTEAAKSLGLNVRDRFIPEADQASFKRPSDVTLSTQDLEAISSARAIVSCLSDSFEGTAYRTALIRTGTDRRRRFAHIPGASVAVLLASADSDDAQIAQRCDDLCLALSLSHRARLTTYAQDQNPAHLDLHLGGLKRPSIQSTGTIPLNTWGNIPGGESFIAPLEDTAQGTFILNGSLRGIALSERPSLLLTFQRGRLVSLSGNMEAKNRLESFLTYAKRHGDTNCDRLAELGVGVNDGIKELTGHPILDEKCSGTAHIAIGGNTRFGGLISSSIHEDLVTRSPSLWLDGKRILDKGQWVFTDSQWRTPLDCVEPASLEPNCILRRDPLISALKRANRLLIRRRIAAGRSSSYTLATDDEAEILATIYKKVPDINASVQCQRLLKMAVSDRVTILLAQRALAVLLRHGLIQAFPANTNNENKTK